MLKHTDNKKIYTYRKIASISFLYKEMKIYRMFAEIISRKTDVFYTFFEQIIYRRCS